MTKTTKLPKDFRFSTAMQELETITTQLESAEIQLDEAIVLFEKGNLLATQIKMYLSEAENTIKTIKSSN